MSSCPIEITTFDEAGYRPIVDFGAWRVAILNYIDELLPERIYEVQQHAETDEVFVLLEGKAVLFLVGGDGSGELSVEMMQPGLLYNVKQAAWHNAVLSRDATILLVENKDTCRENSEYCSITNAQRAVIASSARAVLN